MSSRQYPFSHMIRGTLSSGHSTQHSREVSTPSRQYSQSYPRYRRSDRYYNRPKFQKEKFSYGVACCRIVGETPEILVVRKRYTYAFNLFVHGKYNSASSDDLMRLFNNMTVEEKLDILSFDFNRLWYRVWLSSDAVGMKYSRFKNIFENTFAPNNGTRLISLISRSSSAELIWEIPKGRKCFKTETPLLCAVRELREEARIMKTDYVIYPNAKRSDVYTDDGTIYNNTYYIARMYSNITPKISFSTKTQVEEIAAIKWMSIEQVRLVDQNGRLERVVKPCFNYIKKYDK